ncbi:anthranilate synthase component I family protein [Salinimicrobium tongyeongense]|uniref:Anthranilate synthase component I family protein n=1 Tax=Salinimicrobium tongyeongense TaxID=2809707 RepID=A0ABY6NP63_9FLAO|nr:anthranilate synthase component I family protein [Salinimicrobium tongyeongense]UZH54672.1 anthranilate synthase component I family protein [Salinimicrobium tongyeongense]
MRISKKVKIKEDFPVKKALLHWARQFNEVVWLDSNRHEDSYSNFEALLAVDAFTAIQTDASEAFDKLKEYQETTADWIFGYLTYDLKNDVEHLKSENHDGLLFPELFFFQPKKLIIVRKNELELHYLGLVDDELEEDLEHILQKRHFQEEIFPEPEREVRLKPRISRDEYLLKVQEMLGHIQRGDIYEANFCQEFYAEAVKFDPFQKFLALNAISEPPFAAFLKNHDHYLLSASPERYLQKKNRQVISQPIKGTAPRAIFDAEKDKELALRLEKDPKERSENIMIVDLVRNDLSKTAKKGSVEVTELCGVYSFLQVHQMISTIKSQLDEGIAAVEVLRSTFPMGSMTGAPKISAMQVIEELEETKRGLYSGAVGYFEPSGDFDFNVVIRSILYNAASGYVSFSVGSAITAASIPENEYRECLVKAAALKKVLEEQE